MRTRENQTVTFPEVNGNGEYFHGRRQDRKRLFLRSRLSIRVEGEGVE